MALFMGPQTYALDFKLPEVRNLVHDHERYAAAEVNQLVQDERHDPGGENVILHIGIPRSPCLFENVEVDIVLRDVVKVVGIGDRGGEGGIPERGVSSRP